MRQPKVTLITLMLCCSGMLYAQTAREHAVGLHVWQDALNLIISTDAATIRDPSTRFSVRGQGAFDWTDVPIDSALGHLQLAAFDSAIEVRCLTVRRDTAGRPVPADGYALLTSAQPLTGQGRLALLVDAEAAVALADELARYRDDLRREGWTTELITTQPSRDHRQALAVRALIYQAYQRPHPLPLSHAVLIGQIPVPYAGGFSVRGVYPPPDGHEDHGGAWTADCYYADMEIAPGIDASEAWTDTSVEIADSINAYRTQNVNVPGDGKFDQSTIPSDVELAIGRIDMADLPAFGTTVGNRDREFELLRRYFDKNHRYRTSGRAIPLRALIDDNFHGFVYEEGRQRIHEAFAASAWRSFAPIVEDVVVGDWVAETTQRPSIDTMQSLLTYACGGGGFTHCSYVATTSELSRQPLRSPITMLFGSYFGDVAAQDNIMRAVVAADGDALTCGWSGRPHWFMHPLAAGETVGHCLVRTQNNSGEYQGATAVSLDDGTVTPLRLGERGIHIQLVGDPTVRLPGPRLASLTVRSIAVPNVPTLEIDVAATDSCQVTVEVAAGPDGPWTALTASFTIDDQAGRSRRVASPMPSGYVRVRPYRSVDQHGSRSWTSIWGRGIIRTFGATTGVDDAPLPDPTERQIFDVLGRPVPFTGSSLPPGLYLWQTQSHTGTVLEGFGQSRINP
jgi:hypothetical protein